MGTHMKTTVEIADPLLREAKREAQQSGVTLRDLIELGLRKVLDERRANIKPFKLRDGRVHGGGLQPGIRPGDWPQMRALIYGSRAGYTEGSLEELDRELEEEARYEAENEAKYQAGLKAKARAETKK
jgi:hypothetical protein